MQTQAGLAPGLADCGALTCGATGPEPGDFCLHQLYCQFIVLYRLCTEIHDIFQVLYLRFTGSDLCTSSWMTVSVTQ